MWFVLVGVFFLFLGGGERGKVVFLVFSFLGDC